MLKAVLAFFGISPFTLFIVGLLAAAAGLVGLKLYNAGYASADAKWEIAIARERERVRQENEAALNASRRRIAELNALLAKLEEDLRNADEEARLDPNAARECLGADSVRRIDKIH